MEANVQEYRTPPGSSHVRAHTAFVVLVRRRNQLAWTLTAAMLVIYFGFIGLVAFAPGIMGIAIGSSITLGFALGLGVIVAAIALTGIYVLRANGEFDKLTRNIVADAP
jgi:uncharacterized membrane protein (DUF485 family)